MNQYMLDAMPPAKKLTAPGDISHDVPFHPLNIRLKISKPGVSRYSHASQSRGTVPIHTLTRRAQAASSRVLAAASHSPPNIATKEERYMKLAPRPRHMPVIPCAAYVCRTTSNGPEYCFGRCSGCTSWSWSLHLIVSVGCATDALV